MELKTWKPLADLASIRERVSQLTQTSNVWAPAADWYETDDDLILVLDAPGCDPDSFEIAHDNESLTVAGTREAQSFGEARRRERPEGTFQRSLEVPESVDGWDQILRHGQIMRTLFDPMNKIVLHDVFEHPLMHSGFLQKPTTSSHENSEPRHTHESGHSRKIVTSKIVTGTALCRLSSASQMHNLDE